MIKKSLSIAGHRTSVALEPEFWDALEDISNSTKTPVISIFHDVDKTRTTGLASATRIYILNYYQDQATNK